MINFFLFFTWYADVATPQTKSSGKLSSRSSPLSKRSPVPLSHEKLNNEPNPEPSPHWLLITMPKTTKEATPRCLSMFSRSLWMDGFQRRENWFPIWCRSRDHLRVRKSGQLTIWSLGFNLALRSTQVMFQYAHQPWIVIRQKVQFWRWFRTMAYSTIERVGMTKVLFTLWWQSNFILNFTLIQGWKKRYENLTSSFSKLNIWVMA